MLALQITSMKLFMNHLLVGKAFDSFLLEEAVISTANTYTIDGHINTDFYSPEEWKNGEIPYKFQPWNEIKGLCFNLIKGKHTPLYFKFVLHLKPEKASALLSAQECSADISQIKALVLNIRYDGSKAILTTGTAYHTFIMCREPDNIWDKAVTKYLADCGIDCEVL